MEAKPPIEIDRPDLMDDAVIDKETVQAILRVQRTLRLMNAPHSYKLADAETLLRQAARLPSSCADYKDMAPDTEDTLLSTHLSSGD